MLLLLHLSALGFEFLLDLFVLEDRRIKVAHLKFDDRISDALAVGDVEPLFVVIQADGT